MKNADKPAHPDNWDAGLPGLTKREYFASAAVQALIATGDYKGRAEIAARVAVEAADALLKELEK